MAYTPQNDPPPPAGQIASYTVAACPCGKQVTLLQGPGESPTTRLVSREGWRLTAVGSQQMWLCPDTLQQVQAVLQPVIPNLPPFQ
ncbi:MAG: hypothetical protein JOZ41_00890 [Chloroflexi bacterium]|nr:hypothetical protein [Chloroflexota bacterium]